MKKIFDKKRSDKKKRRFSYRFVLWVRFLSWFATKTKQKQKNIQAPEWQLQRLLWPRTWISVRTQAASFLPSLLVPRHHARQVPAHLPQTGLRRGGVELRWVYSKKLECLRIVGSWTLKLWGRLDGVGWVAQHCAHNVPRLAGSQTHCRANLG